MLVCKKKRDGSARPGSDLGIEVSKIPSSFNSVSPPHATLSPDDRYHVRLAGCSMSLEDRKAYLPRDYANHHGAAYLIAQPSRDPLLLRSLPLTMAERSGVAALPVVESRPQANQWAPGRRRVIMSSEGLR